MLRIGFCSSPDQGDVLVITIEEEDLEHLHNGEMASAEVDLLGPKPARVIFARVQNDAHFHKLVEQAHNALIALRSTPARN